MPARRRFSNWMLGLELIVGLALLALGALFYWLPAAEEALTPRWWHTAVLAALFFLLVWLDWRRRSYHDRVELHETLRRRPDAGP